MGDISPVIHPLLHNKKIFCFGFGYTASFLTPRLAACGWKVSGTTTSHEKKKYLEENGVECLIFDHNSTIPSPYQTFEDVTHVLLSVPPDADGDPVFDAHAEDIAAMPNLEWLGYLSTTAVYGNQEGSWVDENLMPAPNNRRGSLRLKAEQQWQFLHINDGVPLHIFRLAGIYGPGRSAIDTVRSNMAQRIDKPGHVFNRIHIDDIAQTLIASINKPNPGGIYNLADDEPSPSHEVIQFACNLIGMGVPELIPFDQAELAPIVRSFYKDNKRIRNDRIKSELGVQLLHPDYRSGLRACLDIENEACDIIRLAAGSDALSV